MTIIKNPDGTYTIQLTAREKVVMDEVETTHGLGVFNKMFDQWINAHKEAFADISRRDFERQFEALTPDKQEQVLNIFRV